MMPSSHPLRSPYIGPNIEAHSRRWGIDLPTACAAEVRVERVVDGTPTAGETDPWRMETLWRVRLQDPGGAWLKIHSDRAPREEAIGWLTTMEPAVSSGHAVALIGAGLGYGLEQLLDVADRRVLVFEQEPGLIPWLLARRDWTSFIDEGRLLIVAGPTFAHATEAWRVLPSTGERPAVLVHPVLARARPDAAVLAGRLIASAVQSAGANALARKRFEAAYLLNTLASVRRLGSQPGVGVLEGSATRRPIVIAGAGPSLDRNVEALLPHRDQVVLVATDTALSPLLGRGVAPDLVVAVDPGALTARHLVASPVPSQTWLVAEASLDPACFGEFADRVVLFRVDDHAPWPWLRSLGVDPGRLRAWGSVVTTAFDLALRMGGDPIIFIGVDLAYTGGQPYCRGTAYEEDWAQRAHDTQLDVCDVWRDTVEGDATVVTLDLAGEPIRTAPHLLAFRDWLIRASSDVTLPGEPTSEPRIVNATGAGILQGGRITLTPLQDALHRASHGGSFRVDPRRAPRSRPRPRDAADAHLLSVLMAEGPEQLPQVPASTSPVPYMQQPARVRARTTRQLLTTRSTDVTRWASNDNLDVTWERRAIAAARLIPPRSRTLDLGAGLEVLARHLPADCQYVPADVVARSPRTIVVDVNRGEFPDDEFDVVTTLGLLEYVHDVRGLLRRIATRVPTLVASYCTVTRGSHISRLERGWVNHLSLAAVLDMFKECGWHVATASRLDVLNDLDQWLFACRRQEP